MPRRLIRPSMPVRLLPLLICAIGVIRGPLCLVQTLPAAEAPKAQRQAVPDAAAQRGAELEIRKLLREDFQAAKTREQDVVLARSLIKLGEQAKEDATLRYSLLNMAKERAAGAGASGLPVALEAIDRIAADYQVEPWPQKAEALGRALDAARTARGPAADHSSSLSLLNDSQRLVDAALSADQFAAARQMLSAMTVAARRSKNAALIRDLGRREQEARRLEQAFQCYQEARTTLSKDPDDAEAALVAGKWLGFTKGRWEEALPLLAKGSDLILADTAKQDLAAPADPKPQAALAAAWWNQALKAKEDGPARSNISRRSVFWYDKALSKLAGIEKIEAGKARLEALSTVTDPNAPNVPGAVEEGNVALASKGTTVAGEKLRKGTYLLDGVVGGNAYADVPFELTVTLAKTYRLQCIRLHLYQTSQYSYQYALATSSDGKTFVPLAQRSSDATHPYEQIEFQTRPVRAIRLTGSASTYSRAWINISEFEAHCVPPDESAQR